MKLSETKLVKEGNKVYTKITVYDYTGKSNTVKIEGNLLSMEGELKLRRETEKLKGLLNE